MKRLHHKDIEEKIECKRIEKRNVYVGKKGAIDLNEKKSMEKY